MKKLLFTLALSFCLTSCMAQDLKVEPLPELVANFTVVEICDGYATITNAGRYWLVEDKGLTVGKEYLMKIVQSDCNNCFKRSAQLKGFDKSVKQAEIDNREMVRREN